jgi:uncharacterized BrkB/YihY/UPF0761 family membrane protein
MGRAAWPVLAPVALIIAMAWLYLYVPESESKGIVRLAAIVVSAAVIVWGLIGRGQAESDRAA